MTPKIELLAKSVYYHHYSELSENNKIVDQNYIPKRKHKVQRIFNSIRKQIKKDIRNYD